MIIAVQLVIRKNFRRITVSVPNDKWQDRTIGTLLSTSLNLDIFNAMRVIKNIEPYDQNYGYRSCNRDRTVRSLS